MTLLASGGGSSTWPWPISVKLKLLLACIRSGLASISSNSWLYLRLRRQLVQLDSLQ